MFKKLLLIVLAAMALPSFSQVKKTEDFNIVKPEYKTQSNYTTLEIVDSRKDTASYGIVQKGAFNKKALVQPKIPVAVQLDSVFNLLKANAASAPQDTLIIQLRDLKFAERTDAFKESGFFYLRANAYAKKNGKYTQIYTSDIAETVNAMDVTQKNYRNASRIINEFVSKAMAAQPGGTYDLTFDQLKGIEKIEKQSMPLYAAEKLTDGAYTDYKNFRDQIPNHKDINVMRSNLGKIKGIEIPNDKGKYEPASAKDMYAFVENGVPYIASGIRYYPLIRKGDDYFYTGSVKVTADTGTVAVASMMFGIIGGLIAAGNNYDTYEVMIDHINGTTILQNKVKD